MSSIRNACQKVYGNYIAMLLIAAVLNSISQAAIKLLSDDNSAFQILFIRSVFIMAILGLSIHRGDGKYFGSPEIYCLMFLRGFFGALAFIFVTFATFLLPFVYSAFLLNIYPVTTAVISIMSKLERPTFRCWLGVFGCFIGVVVFAEPPFIFGGDDDKWDLQRIAGYLTASLGQALLGYTFILIRRIGKSATVAANSFTHSLGILIMSVPFLPTSFLKPFNYTPSLGEIGLYVLMVISSLGYQVFLGRGFQIGSVVKGSVIFLSTVIYSALFGILVLSDHTSVWTFVGAGILMSSVILVIISRGEKAPVHEESESLLNNDHDPLE